MYFPQVSVETKTKLKESEHLTCIGQLDRSTTPNECQWKHFDLKLISSFYDLFLLIQNGLNISY